MLLANVPLPPKADVDALHIAIAVMNAIDYLLTWNCQLMMCFLLRM